MIFVMKRCELRASKKRSAAKAKSEIRGNLEQAPAAARPGRTSHRRARTPRIPLALANTWQPTVLVYVIWQAELAESGPPISNVDDADNGGAAVRSAAFLRASQIQA